MTPRKPLDPALEHLVGDHLDQLEAQTFLASGGKPVPRGYDLNQPEIYADRFLRPRSEFIDFEIYPLTPELTARIAALPHDFQENEATYIEFEKILQAAEFEYDIPGWCYTTLNERKELWVRRDPR